MRLLINRQAQYVEINGFGIVGVDVSCVPATVDLVHWSEWGGMTMTNLEDGTWTEERFTNVTPYQPAIDSYNEIKARPAPEPTLAQLIVVYTNAVQKHLDDFANSWRYESILSAASYVTSLVPQFKAEAEALIAWRDAVWSTCYQALADVEAGTIPLPTSPADFIAILPATPTRP